MNKFEKLIEYVINDEAAKAQQLFHEIVVEKSRDIYESMMDEEMEDECCDLGGDASDDLISDVETDESGMMEDDEEIEMDFDDEDGFGDEEEIDVDFDDGDEEVSSDGIEATVGDYKVASEKVVDLEDKLDELMAEFEALMSNADEDGFGDEDFGGEEFDDEEVDVDFGADGGDELEMDDTEEFISERESTEKRDHHAEKAGKKVRKDMEWDEEHGRWGKGFEKNRGKHDRSAEKAGRKVTKDIEYDEKHGRFNENVKLQAAPKPVTTEPEGTNKKSINANNSGAVGAVTKPVKMVGDTAHGRANPKVGDLPDAGKFKNVPAKDNSKLSAAPKPVTGQASGVNTRTPFPKD